MISRLKKLSDKALGWWASEEATFVGVLAAICGVLTNTAGVAALHALGVPTGFLDKAGAAAVLIGLLLITPFEKEHPNA